MKRLLACFLCIFCSCLNAKEADPVFDNHLLAGYAAEWGSQRAENADCLYQATSVKAMNQCKELNNIDVYFLATAIAHIGAMNLLPEKIGKYLEGDKNLNFTANIQEEYTGIAVKLNF